MDLQKAAQNSPLELAKTSWSPEIYVAVVNRQMEGAIFYARSGDYVRQLFPSEIEPAKRETEFEPLMGDEIYAGRPEIKALRTP